MYRMGYTSRSFSILVIDCAMDSNAFAIRNRALRNTRTANTGIRYSITPRNSIRTPPFLLRQVALVQASDHFVTIVGALPTASLVLTLSFTLFAQAHQASAFGRRQSRASSLPWKSENFPVKAANSFSQAASITHPPAHLDSVLRY